MNGKESLLRQVRTTGGNVIAMNTEVSYSEDQPVGEKRPSPAGPLNCLIEKHPPGLGTFWMGPPIRIVT